MPEVPKFWQIGWNNKSSSKIIILFMCLLNVHKIRPILGPVFIPSFAYFFDNFPTKWAILSGTPHLKILLSPPIPALRLR